MSLVPGVLLALALLQVEDYYRVESADQPAISPDGRLVAFTRHFIDEDANRRRSELWLAEVPPAGGSAAPRRLSVAGFDASDAAFSPDGKWLVFRSRRGEGPPETASSIWLLRTDGPGEAVPLVGLESLPVFSPDGRHIAFTRETPPEAPRLEPSEREKTIEKRFTGKIYDWMQYRFDRRGYLPDPTDPYETPPEELYVAELTETGIAKEKRLTSLGVDVEDVAFRPDGAQIVFTADSHQRDEYVYERADLWLVDLGGAGEVERLTDDGFSHGSPAFSPDGTRIAFLRSKGLSRVIEEKARRGAALDLFVMDLATRKMVNVTPDWDLRPEAPTFAPDGTTLYFEAGISGTHHLYRARAEVNAPGTEVTQVTRGDRQLQGVRFSGDFSRMAFAAESDVSPSDVFVARIDGTGETRLSRFGSDSVAPFSLSSMERVRYPSKDGTEIEGFVMLPDGYDPGKTASGRKHPLILAIHGGPHGDYGFGFDFQFQLWASRGYLVLFTNPRGSTGYGEDFLWATWGGGWGNLDTEDVLSGVDSVVSRYAVDESRLGVTGYSYGGFLTDWIVTHDHRFAAAVSGAGISNWVSDYGTADIPRTKESEFFGPPWEDESGSLLRRQSPIEYVQNVRTPTLFIHGESDLRVPIEQAEQMYTALKKLGVPAEFIRYPDSYHGGWTPWNTVHRYHHELLWWARYLSPHEVN